MPSSRTMTADGRVVTTCYSTLDEMLEHVLKQHDQDILLQRCSLAFPDTLDEMRAAVAPRAGVPDCRLASRAPLIATTRGRGALRPPIHAAP